MQFFFLFQLHSIFSEMKKKSYLPNDINEKLKSKRVMDQRVGVKQSQVFTWIDLIVCSTQVWPDIEPMLDSSNCIRKSATCKDEMMWHYLDKTHASNRHQAEVFYNQPP